MNVTIVIDWKVMDKEHVQMLDFGQESLQNVNVRIISCICIYY